MPHEASTESPPGDLPCIWQQRAEFLKEYGDASSARLWALAATELEQALRVPGAETLSLVQAARESGYSQDYLGDLVRKGQIPNAGRRNAPRIRRTDLPSKASTAPGRPVGKAEGSVDIRSIVRQNPTTRR